MDKVQFLDICNSMGADPSEMAKEDEFKAFADNAVDDQAAADDLMNALPPVEEMPADVVTEEVEVKTGIDALIDSLDVIIKDEEADKKDVKTAEELKGRLEELKAAEKNAQDFLDKVKAPVVTEEVVAEAAPLGGGVGTLEAEMTTPSATA